MSKRKKHGYVECLKYIHMIQEGVSIHSIHVKYGINADRLHVLWHRYQSESLSGLQKKKNIKADYALKKKIVLDIEEKHLTLHAASLKYGACRAFSVLNSCTSLRSLSSSVSGLLFFFGRPIPGGRPRLFVLFKADNPPVLYCCNHTDIRWELKKVVHPINAYFFSCIVSILNSKISFNYFMAI